MSADDVSPLEAASLSTVSPRAGVVVHRFDLDSPGLAPEWTRAIVSADELAEAEQLKRVSARARAIAARALVRATLAESAFKSTGGEPATLAFELGPNGKPRLADVGPPFSVSHSLDRLLVAVSDAGEVGVDVEKRGVPRDQAGIARTAFNEADRAALGIDADERAFLRVWTAKEAVLKALGVGLQTPMGEVALGARALASLHEELWEPGEAVVDGATFELFDVSHEDDVACLAVQAA